MGFPVFWRSRNAYIAVLLWLNVSLIRDLAPVLGSGRLPTLSKRPQ
jgi:hypothetical protein